MDHVVIVDGRIYLKADGGIIRPAIIIADSNGTFGVPIPGGYNQAGVGFTGTGQNASPYVVNIVNDGDGPGQNERAVVLRIWGRGDADNSIEFFTGNGTFAAPSATLAGQKLAKIAAFGYATNGYCQNDAAVINFNADENFENTGATPLAGNTKSGGTISFETCDLGGNEQKVRALFDAKGNFIVGGYQRAGNGFPGRGMVLLKNAVEQPGESVGDGVYLGSLNGALIMREASAGSVHALGAPYLRVSLSSVMAFSRLAHSKIAFDTVQFDSNAYWEAANKRFNPQIPGTYRVRVAAQITGTSVSGSAVTAEVFKNGGWYSQNQVQAPAITANALGSPVVEDIVRLNGSSDYVEGFLYSDATDPAAAAHNTFMTIYRIGPL